MDCPFCNQELLSEKIDYNIPVFDFSKLVFFKEKVIIVTCLKCQNPLIFANSFYDAVFDTVWIGKIKPTDRPVSDEHHDFIIVSDLDEEPKKSKSTKKTTKKTLPKKKHSNPDNKLSKFIL